jgi:Zn-dependent membrane protease YugP
MLFQFDPIYLLLIAPALLAWFAQAKVREVYQKYTNVPNRLRVSGVEVAKYLVDYLGLRNIALQRVPGTLTDHYDPQTSTLRLSDGSVNATSITALGIVAHEVGHAAQDAEGYRFMRLRGALAQPLAVLAQLSPFIFIGGMLFGSPLFMALAVLMMIAQTVFILVTLPVERNASSRAVQMLEQSGLAAREEIGAVKHVLHAAACTYLAALGRQIASFLFFAAVIGSARGMLPL